MSATGQPYPVCEAHGAMQHKFATLDWRCAGFDGEGCTSGPMSDEALGRVASGQTRWPGIYVERSREPEEGRRS